MLLSVIKNKIAGQTVVPIVLLSLLVVLILGWRQQHQNDVSIMDNFQKNYQSYKTVLDLDSKSKLSLLGDMGQDLVVRDKKATKAFTGKKFDPVDFEESYARPAFNVLNQKVNGALRHIVYCDGQSLTVKFVQPIDSKSVKIGDSCQTPKVDQAIAAFIEKGKTATPLDGYLNVGNEVMLSRYFPITKYSRKAKSRVLQYLVRVDMSTDPTVTSIKKIASMQTAQAFTQVTSTDALTLDNKTETVSMVFPITDLNGQNAAHLKLSKNVSNTIATYHSDLVQSLLMLFGSLVVLCCIIILILKSRVISPIVSLTDTANDLAKGNLDTQVGYHERGDEIGKLAQTLEVFRKHENDRKSLQVEQKAQEEKALQEQRRVQEELANELEKTVGQIVSSVESATQNLSSMTKNVQEKSQHSSEASEAVAEKSERANTEIQATASAVEQLSASTNEISALVERSTGVVNDASQTSLEAQEKVANLAEVTARISEVVGLISGIAEQTNLLALNATIEAARAGEAGKGFAVVAGEVKNLANQTAKATDDIIKQIGDVQQATDTAVHSIQAIANTVNEVSEISSSVSAAITEQSAATDEITRNVNGAAQDANEVNHIIDTVKEATMDSGSAAAQAADAVSMLQSEAQTLQTALDTFLSGIRRQA